MTYLLRCNAHHALPSTLQLSVQVTVCAKYDLIHYLSWVRSLYALYGQGLGAWAWVGLLRHPLPVGAEGTHPRWPGLVHAHGWPTHAGRRHSCSHACWVHVAWHRSRATRTRLVHKLVVVSLGWTHLERGTNLQRRRKKKKKNKMRHAFKMGGGRWTCFWGREEGED